MGVQFFCGSLSPFHFQKHGLWWAVPDGVIKVFSDMKMCKSSTPEEVKSCKKAVLFCQREDVGQTVGDAFNIFVRMLPDKD